MPPSEEIESKPSHEMISSFVTLDNRAKNVTVAVNYELPMVDQFMRVEPKRRSSTNPTGATNEATSFSWANHENDVSNVSFAATIETDESDGKTFNNNSSHSPTPSRRRVSSRDKQKRNTPITRTRVRYDFQLVPVVKRNQDFLDSFPSWWLPSSTPKISMRRSSRISSNGVIEQCQCSHKDDVSEHELPFLENSSVIWVPANRSEWEDTVPEMTAVCTQAALRRRTAVDQSKPFVPPLSRDYIRDRIDIDDPLCGYQLRHKHGGWLQGFCLYTNFTTWTHGFHWDSKHDMSGFPTDDGPYPNMDMDGSLAAELEAQPRSGDPRGGGIVFSTLAEIGLLGGLGCGEYMLRMALTDIWKNPQYKYVVLQATDQSKIFYERFGFVRVGAICQYGKAEKVKTLNSKVTGVVESNQTGENVFEKPSMERKTEEYSEAEKLREEGSLHLLQPRVQNGANQQFLLEDSKERSSFDFKDGELNQTCKTDLDTRQAKYGQNNGIDTAKELSLYEKIIHMKTEEEIEQQMAYESSNASCTHELVTEGSTSGDATLTPDAVSDQTTFTNLLNMPIVGYRHWTHANESEISLKKHGGPSYMMCLKLPERTQTNDNPYLSDPSLSQSDICRFCGNSSFILNEGSFTEYMLSILLVENKPRVEQIGATSTPGGLRFARRSMSMPIDFSSNTGVNSGNASPRVGKIFNRRASDMKNSVTSFNEGESFTSSKISDYSTSNVLRVAKMPKRSHSMAETEDPPRKRQKSEGIKHSQRGRPKTKKAATETRPPPPNDGEPLTFVQKQYHSAWLAVPPDPAFGKTLPSSSRVHPRERAATAAAKLPEGKRDSSTPEVPCIKTGTLSITVKRKVGRPPKNASGRPSMKKVGRPAKKIIQSVEKNIGRLAKKTSTAKSYRSLTSSTTKTTIKAESGRNFHSVRDANGKFIRLQVATNLPRKRGRPPKAETLALRKTEATAVTAGTTALKTKSKSRTSSSSSKSKKANPATITKVKSPERRSLMILTKPGKTRTIDPKTFLKQKVQAFPKDKNNFFNKVVRRKRGSADKYYYVLEYDDSQQRLCLVPMYAKGTLTGQREGRPRYRCDLRETDTNFIMAAAADYVVVRSCAVMKTSVVATEAWDIETSEDNGTFMTRSS